MTDKKLNHLISGIESEKLTEGHLTDWIKIYSIEKIKGKYPRATRLKRTKKLHTLTLSNAGL